MTLLDAPKFDEVRDRRNRVMLYSGGSLLFILIVVFWLVAGHPADWPWNWVRNSAKRPTLQRWV